VVAHEALDCRNYDVSDNRRSNDALSHTQVGRDSTNCIAALRAIIRERGARGLFLGMGPATLRVVPMAIVSFGTYEWVRSNYTKFEESLELWAARQECCRLPSSVLTALI
jgi:hypothetical protein